MGEIIRLDDVCYNYADKHVALDRINMSVNQSEILSVIGSNGSGKSTLFHIMAGLLFPANGQVSFRGEQISERNLKNEKVNAFFRSRLGYVFQNPDSQLFCPTVLDELMFGPLQMGIDQDTSQRRALAIMEMLNIECLADRPTYMLSGGEKKRVAIGSVLTMNPEVLLFDEPMSGLDPKTRAFVIELILQLKEAGKTIVIATHHLELVDHLQSRVVVLSEQHRVEKEGSAQEILADSNLLVRTNLIHENWHMHGSILHKHLPTEFLLHRH
jgi:cobalt/nickel transport system ATP-binding protein